MGTAGWAALPPSYDGPQGRDRDQLLKAPQRDPIVQEKAQAIPDIDRSPAWTVVIEGDVPHLRRVRESILTLGDTRFATRGTPGNVFDGYEPLVAANGLYTHPEGPDQRLLAAPGWTMLNGIPDRPAGQRRILDLRTGVLVTEPIDGDGFRSMRFMSLTRPGVTVLRALDPSGSIEPSGAPIPLDSHADTEQGQMDDITWVRASSGPSSVIAVSRTTLSDGDGGRLVERLTAYHANPDGPAELEPALEVLRTAGEAGFDELLAEQRDAWGRRWADADVRIDGDPDVQREIRFALFHLMACVPTEGEAAVGARGLSGPAYAGHVFWDADVYVLPFLAATCPPAARAMLEYRIRRLPAARRNADERGFSGALFPWESASSGVDVTPRSATDLAGGVVPILTGIHEEHISADVAWAAWQYACWTGDEAFLAGPGADLIVDTARYWASRIRVDADGRGHIDDIIGPDEYHERVDDNAFTNVMARWNLRRGAELLPGNDGEGSSWLALADQLVDGYDPETGLYEQFAGYHQLEPLLIGAIAQPPIAADVLLGRERVVQTQVVKQADVVLLHHLVPEETAPGSLPPNLDHYLPRTAHGSSLSPAMYAAVLARAGRPDEALRLFRLSSALDLHDVTGTTAGGLHTATMGGVWQVLALGFLGLRPDRDGTLTVDPVLPSAWDLIEMRLRFHGHRVRIQAAADQVEIETDGLIRVRLDGETVDVEGIRTFARPGPAATATDRAGEERQLKGDAS